MTHAIKPGQRPCEFPVASDLSARYLTLYDFCLEILLEFAILKLILAIIQPTKLNAVREALEKIGVGRLTVCDAQGFGQQRGQTETYRGREYNITLLRKIALEIVVNDDFLERTIETIESVARTGPDGNIGDGKIFVLPVEETIRIGQISQGPAAV